MAARNGTTGARAAVYRGAAVLFGAEDDRRGTGPLELGLPCIGGLPYYLVQDAQRMAGGRNRGWPEDGRTEGGEGRRRGEEADLR